MCTALFLYNVEQFFKIVCFVYHCLQLLPAYAPHAKVGFGIIHRAPVQVYGLNVQAVQERILNSA